ncbi:hypothetical protein JCM11641_000544 [Rhodosporidiobolus odoratus]
MASYGRPLPPQTCTQPPPTGYPRQSAPPPPAVAAPPHQPGHLPPGTIVNVGDCQVTVERFLSEGGFAHVYLANSAIPLPKNSPTATTKHVLKRMAVPDKRGVEEVGREVDVMRQLKNHPKIVHMIEASVADLPGGVDGSKGYEIYILMEWCPGGGIIDMMNTRLQNRLTESEILKIFSDVVEAVAHMHYQSPPLLHRDLKVENILLTPPNTYKLCDFGSTTKPLPRDKVPTAVEGIQKIELEINKTTTLQYRAPELVDVWGRKGFDEKIDIWALGVLLYKLCFYTTPFEEHGPLAILNAQYKFPPYPAYSSSIRQLIASMLQERASQRPNIYQVHEMTCKLRGAPIRLENKYALSASSTGPYSSSSALPRAATLSPTASFVGASAGSSFSLPPSPVPRPTSGIISSSAPQHPPSALTGLSGLADSISPMRRGRPGKSSATTGQGGTEANRLVRTGLATVGSQQEGNHNASEWENFGTSSAAAAGQSSTVMSSSGFDAAPGQGGGDDGFGDVFAPTSNRGSKSAAVGELGTAIELPANAAMFAELVPPSLAANDAGRKSPMNLLRAQQQQQQQKEAEERSKARQGDEERQRFEAAFPDISLEPDLAPFASSQPSQPQQQSLIDAPSPSPPLPPVPGAGGNMPSQLTGDLPSSASSSAAPGPPLPRRPPTAEPARLPTPGAPSPVISPPPSSSQDQTPRAGFRPNLVSKASQTSPHLLASWRHGSSTPSTASGQATGSGLKKSSVPEFELSSPPLGGESPVPSPSQRLNGVGQGPSKPAFDLLGDDDDDDVDSGNFDALAPGSSRSPAPTDFVASPSSVTSVLPTLVSPEPTLPPTPSEPMSSIAGNVASKRMSFDAAPSPPPTSQPQSGTTGQGQEREKFRPITKRTSWLPSSSSAKSSLGGATASPSGSPKPGLPPKLVKEDEEEAGNVEERFPALSISEREGVTQRENGTREGGEQWEKLVEKEDADDSSDGDAEEAGPPKSATKATAPAFDDEDDFAPRVPPSASSSTSSRPRFVRGFKPSQLSQPSQQGSSTLPPLSSSPAPLASPGFDTSATLSPPPASRGFSTSSSSSASGGGGIDLGPALASIQRFAPSSSTSTSSAPPSLKHLLNSQEDDNDFPPPPSPAVKPPTSPPSIASPKPLPSSRNKAAINSLVSRYDGLGGPLTGGPPPVGMKPVGLRKDSTGGSAASASMSARTGMGTSAHGYLREEVKPRALPQWSNSATMPQQEEEEDDFPPVPPPKPSTPSYTGSSATSRAPFKPTLPPGSPSSSSTSTGYGSIGRRTSQYGAPSSASRPALNAAPLRSPASSPAPPLKTHQQQAEEEERPFAGVSSMKSRWENLAQKGGAGEQGQVGGGGRSVPGGKRKDWAAV